MIRILLAGIAATALLASSPTSADPRQRATAMQPRLFATGAVGDDVLAATTGTGIRTGFMWTASRDDYEAFSRFSGQIMPTAFDSWMFEVAGPIIAGNLGR